MTELAIQKAAKAPRSQQQQPGIQAEKSANTRRNILEAAIRCIVEHGYARSTTSLIAKQAKVSRGAMMHHFPSREAVLKAAIRYLHRKQLTEYRKLMEAVEIPSEIMTREKISQSIAEAWKYVNLPCSVAYQEILMVARTNRELREVLEPLEKEFEKSFIEAVKRLFPPWAGRDELEVVHDAALSMLTGMMLNHMRSNKKQRTKQVLDFLTQSVEHYYAQLGPGL